MFEKALRSLSLVSLVAGLLAGCGPGSGPRNLGTRAVVIGIDGADPGIVEELSAEGALPHLTDLRRRGVWGRIETLRDIPLSPVIWTSVATGRSPADHGISWFMVDRADGTRAPVRSHNRKVKAIWNIVAEADRHAAVVGWWATYPAENLGRGTMVSDALGYHGFGASARRGDDSRKTWPPDLFARVDAMVPPLQQITIDYAGRFFDIQPEIYEQRMFLPARQRDPNPMNPFHLFQQYAVTAEGYTAIGEELLRERPWDLFMLYYEQIDSLSHLFMKYAPPKLEWVDEERHRIFRDVVREWYLHQDELLGRLLAAIDLDTTAVFLLSDHGFKSGERRIRSEETVDVRRAHLDHERQGILLAAGPHVRRGASIEGASVMDLTPTVLHYLGFPVAKDMDGRVLERLFAPAFLGDHPIRYVASYEEKPGNEAAPADETDDEEAARQLQALRTLGYVGGGSSPDEESGGATAGEETSPEILTNLGRIHLANGDLRAAREQFAKALELEPNHAEALLALGESYRLEGRTADARHVVERALRVDPNSIGALAQLGEIARDRGELEEAVRLFEEALSIDDSLPFLFLGYGDVLQRAGRFEEAERAFHSVLELDPDSFKARYNLGVTAANQGRVDQAIDWYKEALEVGPGHPEAAKALNNLGAIHQEQGQIESATEWYERAVRASPAHLESRFNLAAIYLETGRAPAAIELLEQAAAIQPNHELVAVQLGMALLRVGRNQDAFKSFLLVRRLYPDNWQAALGLALLYADSGQGERAAEQLADALRAGGEAARHEAEASPLLKELL